MIAPLAVNDQLGNRLEKFDPVAQRQTCDLYDTDPDRRRAAYLARRRHVRRSD